MLAIALSTLLDYAQLAALVSAALWLLVKASAGYYYPSLSLSADLQRSSDQRDHEVDILVVSITAARGSSGTITLDDITIRVCPSGAEPIDQSLPGINRLKVDRERRRLAPTVFEDATPDSRLNLPAGETFRFAWAAVVPRASVCAVDVVLLGSKRPYLRTPGQWRTRVVSVPNGAG